MPHTQNILRPNYWESDWFIRNRKNWIGNSGNVMLVSLVLGYVTSAGFLAYSTFYDATFREQVRMCYMCFAFFDTSLFVFVVCFVGLTAFFKKLTKTKTARKANDLLVFYAKSNKFLVSVDNFSLLLSKVTRLDCPLYVAAMLAVVLQVWFFQKIQLDSVQKKGPKGKKK